MMSEDIDESSSSTTVTTFRFASGEVLSLDEDQINKIPYLTAIVSAAKYFELTCDEDGHCKLDPQINYEHFSFVLESLSFHSIRQLFTHLPKKMDIISIIALLEFLGLGSQTNPTLNEVDSTFFSTVVYSPLLGKHLQIVRPTVIQDMAVRFAIAMAKEEYDFTKQKVIDQLYWFIMFILSAYDLFGSCLRHHVSKIAEHCFYIFKPSLLKPLKQLIFRTEKESRQYVLTTDDFDMLPDKENECPMEKILYVILQPQFDWFLFDTDIFYRKQTLDTRNALLYNRIYGKPHFFSWWRLGTFYMEHYINSAYKRVLEIMYERLQSDICRRTVAELRDRNNPYEFVWKRISLRWNSYILECETLPKRIDDLFKSEPVQEEIYERILEEIHFLTSKLEQRRVKLVEQIQLYERWLQISHENGYNPYFIPFSGSSFEKMQEEVLSIELVLGKSPEDSSIFKDIYKHVLDGLRVAALRQLDQWENTKYDIDVLYEQLTQQHDVDDLFENLRQYPPSKESRSGSSKVTYQHHRMPVNKSLFKHQLKYSGR